MIEIIFVVSIVVLFLYETTREGQIFSVVSKGLAKLPDYIKKPLFDCPICMSPWWGSLILFMGNMNGLWYVDNWFGWITILFGAGGVNTFLIYVINQGKAIAKTLKEYECNCTKNEDKDLERKERLAKISGGISNVHMAKPEDFTKH